MKSIVFYSYILVVLVTSNTFSQIIDEELGSTINTTRAGLYDFSDRGAINIRVSVWGYVTRPGKYIIPDYTTVSDLLSYAGGPNQNAEMDDLRIFRLLENGQEEIIKFTYDDIMWGTGIEVKNRILPKLEPSDILIVPGAPRYFFRDWFNLGLQLFASIIAVVNLIILTNRY